MAQPADIGISSSAYAELLLPAALERIAELGTAAEIRSFGLHTLLSVRNRREALTAGLPYTVHGPFGYTGIGDVDESARREALDEHRRHIAAAAEVGARLYVAHPDWHPEGTPHDPAVVDALERSFRELLELQSDTGVEVVIENMPGAGQSRFTHPGDLDLQGLGLILDVGHASISGCLDEWLTDPRARLRHVHLHDNHGAGDNDDPHLPLGRGVVDVHDVLDVARVRRATVILELLSEAAVDESLAFLRAVPTVWDETPAP